MKTNLLFTFITVTLFLIPNILLSQVPNLGTTANFVIFSKDGAVSSTGISQLTGKVGTNNGSSTGFGNVNGGMHDNDGVSAQAATDLLVAYNDLDTATPDFYPAALLGNGQKLNAGVYSISSAATLNSNLTLDAQSNSNAIFIFQISGTLSTNANSKVHLVNGAQACNVFWKVEGLVDMAAGTTMRGTIIANNAGINMNTGDTLEGRALTTTGAISIDGVLAYTPVGCGSAVLTGPAAPTLGEVGCYGLFSSDGPVTNTGTTNVVGAVGANVGLTTGFDSLLVTGNIHPKPDGSTSKAATDLLTAYNSLNGYVHDIELLYPAQFGRSLVLTPHTYLLNAATSFTDTLYLNAQGNASAVFVIKIEGALTTSTYSKVILTNGTKAKNVFWMINGAVDINEYSVFRGNIISQGAIKLDTGVTMNGRALTGVGSLETAAMNSTAVIPGNCQTTVGGVSIADGIYENRNITVYPNPFCNSTTIRVEDGVSFRGFELSIYNDLGIEVIHEFLTEKSTTVNTENLPAGIYFYRVKGRDQTLHSGRLIAQK